MPTTTHNLSGIQRIALGLVALWLFGWLLAPTLHAASHARIGTHTHDALGITHADHAANDAPTASSAHPAIGARPSAHGLGHTPVAILSPPPALPPLVAAPPCELPELRRTDDAPPPGCASSHLPRGPPQPRSA